MKRLVLLVIMTMMSCTCFSQALIPKIYLIEEDTFFCFLPDQAKLIAITLDSRYYQDSILAQQHEQLSLQESLLEEQGSTLALLENQAANYRAVIKNQRNAFRETRLQLGEMQRQIKKQKRGKIFFGTGLGVSLGVIGFLGLLN